MSDFSVMVAESSCSAEEIWFMCANGGCAYKQKMTQLDVYNLDTFVHEFNGHRCPTPMLKGTWR